MISAPDRVPSAKEMLNRRVMAERMAFLIHEAKVSAVQVEQAISLHADEPEGAKTFWQTVAKEVAARYKSSKDPAKDAHYPSKQTQLLVLEILREMEAAK